MEYRTFEFLTSEPISDNNVATFCRSRDRNEKERIDFVNSEPYFFVRESDAEKASKMKEVVEVIGGEDSDHEFEGLEGESLAKVFLRHPGQTRNVRQRFSKTWESDVRYTQRVRIDQEIRGVFRVPEMMLQKKGENHWEAPWSAAEGLDEEPVLDKRNLYFDIEVGGEGFSDPYDDELEDIVSITSLDSFTDEVITWTFRPDFDQHIDSKELDIRDNIDDLNEVQWDIDGVLDWEVRKFDSKGKMARNFANYLREGGFDVLSGWYSDGYDTPYLIRWMRQIGVQPKRLSPLGDIQDGSNKYEQPKISGIIMNDLERRYDKIEDPTSTRLEDVARDEAGIEWEQESSNIEELWWDDVEKMLRYNAIDVVATCAVDKSSEISDFFISKMASTGAPGEKIERATPVIDTYHLFEANKDEKLPRTERQSNQSFGGGAVFMPDVQGVLKNVMVADLSRIYPSIMLSCFFSYENYLGRDVVKFNEDVGVYDEGEILNPGNLGKDDRKSLWNNLYDMDKKGNLSKSADWEFVNESGHSEDGIRIPNGVWMNEDPEAITCRVLRKMYELRDKYEEKIDNLDEDDDDYIAEMNRLLRQRQVEKDNINAVFGYAGYGKSRLFQPEIAESITFVGRHLLKVCRKTAIEDKGVEVVYGDTDSIMFRKKDADMTTEEAVDLGFEVSEHINDRMDDFANNFCGIEEHEFKIEFEKLYSRMFLGNKKKRYAGYKTWDERPGFLRDDAYVDITGFEYVRGDSPDITGALQKDIFEAILADGAGKDKVLDIVEEYYLGVKNAEFDPLDCVRAPSLGGWDKQANHASAARFMSRFFENDSDVRIEEGDNIYTFYTKDGKTGYDHNGDNLPENRYIGLVRGMKPPLAKCTCNECNHEWEEKSFAKRIDECPDCGSDDFIADGAYVDWDKIADKVIMKKAKKLGKHLGWADEMDTVGKQQTLAAF